MIGCWRLRNADETLSADIALRLSLPLPIARVLVARGLDNPLEVERFLHASLREMADPFSVEGMASAADRVAGAVVSPERVLVHGDFDADGVTAAALLKSFLCRLGADAVAFVPNRLIERHGISARAVAMARREGFSLFVTCDCGIASLDAAEELSNAGISVVVTDHHLPRGKLPRALIVNPRLPGSDPVHAELSGVGVAFMLAAAVRSRLREKGFFSSREEPNLREYLDMVALGTLADMAALRGQNRILVSEGLRQLVASRRPGIVAMREICGLGGKTRMDAEDVGFRLAPRINAAARLGRADDPLELLLTDDHSRALELAEALERGNAERKRMQERMYRLAVTEASLQASRGAPAVVVASEDFHPGIVGLIAQKLVSELFVTAAVFAVEGGVAKGSARSGHGVDLGRALEGCRDILTDWGGHAEAAGCSLPSCSLDSFRGRFVREVSAQGVDAAHVLLIDAEVSLGQLNREFLCALDALRPFGSGNREPVFSSLVRVVGSAREVGVGHVRAGLREPGGRVFSAIGFGLWQKLKDRLRGEIEVAFSPQENCWGGRREVQLRLHDVRDVRCRDN